MLRWLLAITVVSFVVLVLPDWKPPYSMLSSWIILLGYLGLFGPGFLLLAAVLNRLINISFCTR